MMSFLISLKNKKSASRKLKVTYYMYIDFIILSEIKTKLKFKLFVFVSRVLGLKNEGDPRV